MRWAVAFLIALVGCESSQVVSFDERRDNQHDFAPRVRRVSGSTMVRVALFRPTVATAIKGTVSADQLYDLWRREFEDDSEFDLVAQKKVDKAQRDEARGEVDYFSMSGAQRVSIQVHATMVTATIGSKVSGTMRSFSVEGDFRQNKELLKLLADQVKQALRE